MHLNLPSPLLSKGHITKHEYLMNLKNITKIALGLTLLMILTSMAPADRWNRLGSRTRDQHGWIDLEGTPKELTGSHEVLDGFLVGGTTDQLTQAISLLIRCETTRVGEEHDRLDIQDMGDQDLGGHVRGMDTLGQKVRLHPLQ